MECVDWNFSLSNKFFLVHLVTLCNGVRGLKCSEMMFETYSDPMSHSVMECVDWNHANSLVAAILSIVALCNGVRGLKWCLLGTGARVGEGRTL